MNPIAISVKDRKIEQYLILHLWKFPESERKLFDKDYNLSIYSREKGLESFLSIANGQKPWRFRSKPKETFC